MKKNIAFLILFVSVLGASAQVSFQRTYGIGLYNEGRCVKQTFDGGYIVAGTASDAGTGSSDFYLLKVDSLGNFQWHKVFGGSNIDRGFSVLETSDSGYAICGYTNSFGINNNYDGYFVRTDKNGDTLWTKTFGGTDWDFMFSLRQTSDAGFILSGNTYSNSSGNSQAWLVKTDSTGNLQWAKSWDMTDDVFINAMTLAADGGCVLAGYRVNQMNGTDDLFLIRTTSAGDTAWTKTIGDATANERANAVDVNSDSSIVVAGSLLNVDSVHYQGYLVKMDAAGSVLFTQFINGSGDDELNDIHFLSDSIVVAGYTTSIGFGHDDMRIVTLNPGGFYIGGTTKGGIKDDIAYHVERTTDGGYILCGSSTSYTPGLQSLYLVKFDSLFQTTNVAIGIEELPAASICFSNYPNPFNDFTTIDLVRLHASGNLTISVFNSLGEKVFGPTVTAGTEMKIYRNDLPAGIYHYRVSDSQKTVGYGKLVVE